MLRDGARRKGAKGGKRTFRGFSPFAEASAVEEGRGDGGKKDSED
jgi:hypothetical protein